MLVAEGPQIGRAARSTKSKYTAEKKVWLNLWALNLQGIFFLSFAAFCQL